MPNSPLKELIDEQIETSRGMNLFSEDSLKSFRFGESILDSMDEIIELTCPVHVVHGENDPHPVEGVVEPLRKCRVKLTCHVLKNCSHSPF